MAAVDIGARFLLAVVFATAVASKLTSRSAFREFRESVREFVAPIPTPIAWSLIAGEAAVGPLVLIPATVYVGYALGVALLCLFTMAVIVAIRTDRVVPCRCFGGRGAVLAGRHLSRNVLLLCAALVGISSHASAIGATPSIPTIALAATAGALLGAVVAQWDDLAYLVLGEPETR